MNWNINTFSIKGKLKESNITSDIFRFTRFAIVGVMNTLINWLIFFLLNNLGSYYIISNIVAYIIATMHSYFWNRLWVFKYKKGSTVKTSIKFILLNIVGLILSTTILFILVDKFYINKFVSLVLTTLVVMVINYMFNKIWVFKNNLL